MSEAIFSLGRKGLEVLSFLREIWRLLVAFLYWLLIGPFKGFKLRFAETARQMVRVGVNSIRLGHFGAFERPGVRLQRGRQPVAEAYLGTYGGDAAPRFRRRDRR